MFGGLFDLDPTLGLGDKVLDHIEQAQKEESEWLKGDHYAFCPGCGKKQIKENLLENGCFACGWKGTEGDIESAMVKLQSGRSKARPGSSSYKANCPNCGTLVITEEFLEKGCWRCGYKE